LLENNAHFPSIALNKSVWQQLRVKELSKYTAVDFDENLEEER